MRSVRFADEVSGEDEWLGEKGTWYVKDRDIRVLTVDRAGQDRLVCSLGRPSADGGWREIAAVVDSGAEETVAPPGLFPGEVAESPMQRSGGRYRAANGARIPNLGQQRVSFRPSEGHGCSLRFQVADVERPLISVSQLGKTGHKVEFDGDKGHIVHVRTGRRLRLQREGGVYVLKVRVRVKPDQSAPGGTPGFTRHGR